MNPAVGLIRLLKADTAVADITTNIFYAGGRKVTRADFPFVMIQTVPMDGADPELEPLNNALFDVRCYAVDQPAAWALYTTVRAALHGKTGEIVSGLHFHSIVERLSGSDLAEDISDTEIWNGVLASFEAEVEAA